MRFLVIALLCVPLGARAEDRPLTVLAAASLKAPLEASAAAFEKAHPGTHVVVSAAATGVLVKQVENGAPADVLVGAATLDATEKQKLIGPQTIVARNALVVAAPAKSTLKLEKLADLAQPAFTRIGIGKPGVVPAGDYAKSALEHSKLLDTVTPRLVFGDSVTQVLTYVRGGDVDAGFVYASDAQAAKGDVRVLLTVPADLHAPIVYPAAVVTKSAQPELAAAYVKFLREGDGAKALRDAGLLAP